MDEPETSSAEVLGNETLSFLEHLKGRYGEDFTIGETMLLAEVIVERDGEELSCLEFAASDSRRYVQVGFLTTALRGAERMLDIDEVIMLPGEEDEPDED